MLAEELVIQVTLLRLSAGELLSGRVTRAARFAAPAGQLVQSAAARLLVALARSDPAPTPTSSDSRTSPAHPSGPVFLAPPTISRPDSTPTPTASDPRTYPAHPSGPVFLGLPTQQLLARTPPRSPPRPSPRRCVPKPLWFAAASLTLSPCPRPQANIEAHLKPNTKPGHPRSGRLPRSSHLRSRGRTPR